eukprot:PITA_23697
MALMSKCVVTEPSSFEETVEDPAWVDAMVEEYDSIVRNSAWEIVPRPEGKLVVGSRWIYKFKQMGWHIHQLYVKTAFLPRVCRKEDATSAEVVDATGYQQLVDSHVCRLKRGTSGYGLDEVKLCGFMDVDWAGSSRGRKSTSGGVFSIGSTTVSSYSRKQRSVALSSAEAEYMAAILAACEALWMRKILVGLFVSHLDPTMIYCDNQSCIKLSANPVFHDRSKHIDIRYHHIRDCVQRRIMLFSYIPTEDQDADILTKALTRSKFEYHRGMIGVADNPYLVEREC